MSRRTRPGSEPGHPGNEAPLVLPRVIIIVAADGTMSVTVDDVPHDPPAFAPSWRREDFAHIIDQLTGQHRCPLRIEVREADGSVFTDIITPRKRRRSDTRADLAQPTKVPGPPEFLVLHGEGFVPGEDVAVAVVLAVGEAAPDGTVRALVTAAQLANSQTGEAILLGRVSGTSMIGLPQ